jgi:hypothetical protein
LNFDVDAGLLEDDRGVLAEFVEREGRDGVDLLDVVLGRLLELRADPLVVGDVGLRLAVALLGDLAGQHQRACRCRSGASPARAGPMLLPRSCCGLS